MAIVPAHQISRVNLLAIILLLINITVDALKAIIFNQVFNVAAK